MHEQDLGHTRHRAEYSLIKHNLGLSIRIALASEDAGRPNISTDYAGAEVRICKTQHIMVGIQYYTCGV